MRKRLREKGESDQLSWIYVFALYFSVRQMGLLTCFPIVLALEAVDTCTSLDQGVIILTGEALINVEHFMLGQNAITTFCMTYWTFILNLISDWLVYSISLSFIF